MVTPLSHTLTGPARFALAASRHLIWYVQYQSGADIARERAVTRYADEAADSSAPMRSARRRAAS